MNEIIIAVIVAVIVGGISLKGAYPTPAFEEIIDR